MPEEVFTPTGDGIAERWPHITMFLSVNNSDVCVDDDFPRWLFANERTPTPCPEMAAAYEEWADYFEWCLAQRADELAADRGKRRLAEKWTDSMAYCCRRLAAWARGEHPGKWLPEHQRRPNPDAERHAIAGPATVSSSPLPQAS